MTTNQPPRKRTLLEILTDVENDDLTAEQAEAEIVANEASAES
tara:strand:- start:21580 stop:21708 length:129 start_codon:yes stop_codon:yes gene_type:complete